MPRDLQELWALKRGDDQGGTPRTWDQVAQILGVSGNYLRRIASGRAAAMPQQVRIDPRAFLPELVMTDADVEAWNDSPSCLCGCGSLSRQEGGNNGKVPYGAYRLFVGSHEKRMPWARRRQAAYNQDPERIARAGRAQLAGNQHAAVLAGLLLEYRARYNSAEAAWSQLAAQSGLTANHIRSIAHGRRSSVLVSTFARLMVAVGEPLRPEHRVVYDAWAAQAGRPTLAELAALAPPPRRNSNHDSASGSGPAGPGAAGRQRSGRHPEHGRRRSRAGTGAR